MKRIFKVLLSFCLVFCLLPSHAFAANTTYELDELDMSIEIPSDHVVFTRDIKANDPNLSDYGLTKVGLSSLMQERNIYLNAWDEDVNYEIIITMMDSPFEDYNQFSDTSLNGLVSALKTEYADMGITFIRSDLYQHSQAKFAKIYISQPNNSETAYGLQYNTVYDGKAINITLQSYSGEIDSSKESILKKIVDSVHFDTEPQLNAPPAQTKAFTYTDPNSKMTFTVPANWVETPMNEEREYIDVKFISNLEEGLCIIFSSEDMLSDDFIAEAELTDFEKLMISRSVLDNSIFTKTDVAAMWGGSEKDVSMVTYGGKEYYSAEVVTSGTAYGLNLSTPMVYLLRCENGYMYIFQFNGSSSSKYFKDFEALVSSAEYPVFEDDLLTQRRVIGIVFLLIVAVLVITFSLLRRIKKKQAQVASNSTPIPTDLAAECPNEVCPVISEVEIEAPEIVHNTPVAFCHKCGNKLEPGSRFCHKCGTLVPTKEEN